MIRKGQGSKNYLSRKSLLNVKILIYFIFLNFYSFFGQSGGHAATYYVSPTGNDSNPGTESQPWRTIVRAVNSASAGDTVIVKDGVYEENIEITRSGNPDAPIYFKAQNRHQAIIKRSGLGWPYYAILGIGGNYIKIEGFKFLLMDGARGAISVNGSYNQILDCYVTTESTSLGLNNTGIGIGGSYNIVSGNHVEKMCFGYGLSGTNNIFEKNEATKLKINGSCGDVDYMRFFGKNHIIRNNKFYGINFQEIGSAHVDCFQTFDNGGPENAINNVIVEGNYCSDAHQGMMLEGKIYKQSRGLIVRNNIFTKCGAWCVCLMDIADAHFYNNTCDTTGGLHGIWCRGDGNVASCEFKNNIIYGTGSLYGVFETATLIDGTPEAPGKNNLLYKPGVTITGFANDIKNVDPLFEDRTVGNYRIRGDSPAKDKGLAISNWFMPTDIEGKSRPQGNGWDIGAYEYGYTILSDSSTTLIESSNVSSSSNTTNNVTDQSGSNLSRGKKVRKNKPVQ